MKSFGQLLEDLGYDKTVAAGWRYSDPKAPDSERYVFGTLNPAIPYPSLQRYFGMDQQTKGSISGGESVSVTALNNAIRQGLFPGAQLINEADPTTSVEAVNDLRYVFSGQYAVVLSRKVPLTLWDLTLKAHLQWQAAHENPRTPTDPVTPAYPDLRPDVERLTSLVSRVHNALKARLDTLSAVELPEVGGGIPIRNLREEIVALKTLIDDLGKELSGSGKANP